MGCFAAIVDVVHLVLNLCSELILRSRISNLLSADLSCDTTLVIIGSLHSLLESCVDKMSRARMRIRLVLCKLFESISDSRLGLVDFDS